MKYVFLSFLILSSCGGTSSSNGPYLDSRVVPIYNKFMLDAKNNSVTMDPIRIKTLNVYFDIIPQDDPENYYVLGYCEKDYGINRVVLDTYFWNNSNSLTQEEVLMHELGHCLLDRKHRPDIDKNTGLPSSLMYPYLIPYWEYNQDEQTYGDYIGELFTNLNDWTNDNTMGCKFKIWRTKNEISKNTH